MMWEFIIILSLGLLFACVFLLLSIRDKIDNLFVFLREGKLPEERKAETVDDLLYK